MTQMKEIQDLLESGRNEQTFSRAQKLYDINEQNEQGLNQCLIRMDKEFGTSLKNNLNDSLASRDPMSLKKTLQTIAFLLMLEKFNFIQENFNNKQGH
ncbi:hypothetical protein MYX76_18135 [Desulfobacterota bacterium AH_259_B03_O07]|nr:hypothetical protein [Desulfobacterota bacterium AH_259_B03_O07]